MRVKVCGLTDKTNMDELVKSHLNYMGFIFYSKSKRSVINKEVAKRKYSGIKKVGVFVNESIEKVIELVNECELDVVQLHATETPTYCEELKKTKIEIIKAFSIDDSFDFATTLPYKNIVNYFLFDTRGKNYGGNGVKFEWDKLEEYDGLTPFFLSGGIGVEDVLRIKAIKNKQLVGVDINSQFEIEPGKKNLVKVNEFISQIRGTSR